MSDADDKRDTRAIILARRRIFLATALAAAVGGGCDPDEKTEQAPERPRKPRKPKPETGDPPYGPNVCLKIDVVDPPSSATPSTSASASPSASASQATDVPPPMPRVCLKRAAPTD